MIIYFYQNVKNDDNSKIDFLMRQDHISNIMVKILFLMIMIWWNLVISHEYLDTDFIYSMKISRSDLENKTCGLRNQTALRLGFEMLNKKFITPYTCKIQYNAALYI